MLLLQELHTLLYAIVVDDFCFIANPQANVKFVISYNNYYNLQV